MGKQLNVLICGAGLGGLMAAIALAKKGHKVTVLEAAPQLNEVGAGIQIPPNSTRLIAQYGLTEKFLEKIVWPSNINFRNYLSGQNVGTTPLHPIMTEKYGYPYWLIHRADYQQILFDAAVAFGVDVRLGSWVDRVDEFGPAGPTLTLANGTVLTGDLIIGADGIRSRTRASILRERDLQAVASPNYAYRATVPAAIMNADPEIAHLMTDINSNCWIGSERHIMAYPIRNGEMYNIVMSHPEEGIADGAWNQPGDLNEMRTHYANWDPLIRKVLSYVTGCMKWKLAKMPALPTWVSDNGKVVIIGDAAHGMVPYLAQGAAVALEDGVALAECVSRAESVDDLPVLLKAFEAIRKPRSELISDAAMENGKIWHYADGPEQQERDRRMQLTPEQQEAEDDARSAHVENPNKWSDKNFQPWLFGYDTVKETNDFLDGLKLGSKAAESKVAEVSML